MKKLCSRVGISRQAYYKSKETERKREVKEKEILQEVQKLRYRHPRMGVRKLHYILKGVLNDRGIFIGRDKMFNLLRRYDMLVKRKRGRVFTTYSRHNYRIYKNLIKGIKVNGVNEVWQADITYINTEDGYLYLSLITDALSRKIVGYNISDSLESEGSIKALKMAIRSLPPGDRPIHHSDKGIQYCSSGYRELLLKNFIKISMTERDHCAENALAERVNGILKTEYFLDNTFNTKEQARLFCLEAIRLYNDERPHLSLNYACPSEIHNQGLIKNLKKNTSKKEIQVCSSRGTYLEHKTPFVR